HLVWQGYVRAARRADARGVAQRIVGGKLVAGRRQQRYLGAAQRHVELARDWWRESATKMLSRVADSIFWMTRYIERAENVARFIDVNHNLSLELGDQFGDQWAPLIYTTGDHE